MKCVPSKFQRGDEVSTPAGLGTVTAVGVQQSDTGKIIGVVYRVGRNQYFYEWQMVTKRRGKN